VARAAAQTRQHPAVGTEHLLLALVADQGSVAAVALARLGVDRAAAERAVDERFPAGPSPVRGRLRFTDPARRTLELALGEALGLGHNYIGTEHVVLGLVHAEGAAAEILADQDVTYEALRDACLTRLAEITGGAA
jgi:ATP-dependent Clp protease ATP-binding subunit ClpC